MIAFFDHTVDTITKVDIVISLNETIRSGDTKVERISLVKLRKNRDLGGEANSTPTVASKAERRIFLF